MLRTDSNPEVSTATVIPSSQVHLVEGAARVGLPGHEPDGEPQINLIREGDTIRAIEVICTCGKRTVLSCVY